MKQNEKILHIARILMENTNEDNPMTANMLIEKLSDLGIPIERKSIYSAVDTLLSFGYDIQKSRMEPKGYYISTRDFELPEIKLLVDAVQSSKFITSRKSIELINKIKKLTDKNSAKKLQRQVIVSGRVKMANERVYYSIDAIHEAIADAKKISFKYCEYDINKELIPRKGGKVYKYTPVILIWDDERYYLINYDEKHNSYTHFRADKMIDVVVLEERAAVPKRKLDAARYSKSVFSMFNGEFEDVEIAADNRLVGAFLDKFGMDITIRKYSPGEFSVKCQVAVSNTFFAWLFQYGNMARIISPQKVVEEYKNHIKDTLDIYKLHY